MLKIKNAIKRLSILTCTFFIAISNMSLPVHAKDNISIGKEILYSYKGYNPDGSVVDETCEDIIKRQHEEYLQKENELCMSN